MPSEPITLIWALHDQRVVGHDQNKAWRGVVAAHYNSLDLVEEKQKKYGERKMPDYWGYVYDPSTNKDIVLNEIEGRLLECNLFQGQLKKEQAAARAEGKMTIMIDNEARHGGRPDYPKQRAFMVGFSTLLPKEGTKSPMTMRYVWRDNTSPAWGSLKDSAGVECTLLPMYFVASAGIKDLTQERPTYTFPGIVWGAGPTPRIVQQAPMALMAQQAPLSDLATEETASVDVAAPVDGTAPVVGTTTVSGTTPIDGSAPIDGNVPTDGDDGDRKILGGETIQEVEAEMDQEPAGETDDEPVQIEAEGGVLKW